MQGGFGYNLPICSLPGFPLRTLTVDLGDRSCPIHIGAGLLNLPESCRHRLKPGQASENLNRRQGAKVPGHQQAGKHVYDRNMIAFSLVSLTNKRVMPCRMF